MSIFRLKKAILAPGTDFSVVSSGFGYGIFSDFLSSRRMDEPIRLVCEDEQHNEVVIDGRWLTEDDRKILIFEIKD